MNLKIIITLLVLSQLIFSQQRKISGMVKDSIGEAIAGANIVIEGTNRGTNTGIDGKYSIKVYPNEFLVFSFVGKKNQRISADKNEINIQLIDNGIKIIEVLPYTPHINKKEKTNFVNVEKNSLNKKKIRGFIFDNSYFTSIPLPFTDATIEVKGTGRKTISDIDGKFEIEAQVGDVLIVCGIFKKTKIISVTDKNCYKINFDTNLLDYPIIMDRRTARISKRKFRKYERKIKDKIGKGFYDCLD